MVPKSIGVNRESEGILAGIGHAVIRENRDRCVERVLHGVKSSPQRAARRADRGAGARRAGDGNAQGAFRATAATTTG